tara:strand:+ start:330 stop:1622 length:1293 start_codon:yes stop_codon:yes gene_type:complete
MISILVYPNITYSKDLEKDSYVVVLSNVIKELNKVRDDLFFTILSPKFIKSLKFHNTKQIPIQLPTYPNQMRLHFNSIKLLEAIDWKNNDYDIVYSHLPEHTLQLKNLFYNETNERPVFVGYTHWTEFKEITGYPETVIDINILGLLAMDACGVNTLAQKNMIINAAKENYNQSVINKLEKTLRPMYLGSEKPEYDKNVKDLDKKVIVFNHRPHKYKRYDWFLSQMDKLWEQRKDFEVWVPLAESVEKPYMTNDKYDRHGYFTKLSQCFVGVCCKQLYAGWAISATDGMSVGVPYLFSDDRYYHELADDSGLFYKDEKDFNSIINKLLDDKNIRASYSNKSLSRFEDMLWEKQIVEFNDMIDSAILQIPKMKKPTKSYNKMKKYIKKHGNVSKRDLLNYMNWGVRIGFSGYRNRLRNDGIDVQHDSYTYA